MTTSHQVWFQDPLQVLESQLANPSFNNKIDYAPKKVTKGGKRQYKNLMSGKWAWAQADAIAQDPDCHGVMFAPVILGSDKTTVSVATGQNNFYPLCTAYPEDLDDGSKAQHRSHQHTNTLLQGCLLAELWDVYGIVSDLVVCNADILVMPQHIKLDILPQPFTKSFPCANIHELLVPDLLHQIIKGTFKDHIVDWVMLYIKTTYMKQRADKILADIDRRIALVPPFPGLHHFSKGHGFKQWTGSDSKGLMKVYLPAIAGHVPDQMVQAVVALIKFCYLVCHNIIDDNTISAIEEALLRFHTHHEIFRKVGVRPNGFLLPCQHSLKHYVHFIKLFGAPNGLCSSITENKHIKVVKQPYRCSNKYKPLGQMLLTNQCLNKLAAARVNFTALGMLEGAGLPDFLLDGNPGPPPPPPLLMPPLAMPNDNEQQEMGAVDDPKSQVEIMLAKCYVRKVPKDIYNLARHLNLPWLPELTQRYLHDIIHPDTPMPGTQVTTAHLPHISGMTRIYMSAAFMQRTHADDLPGFTGLNVAH
ncbi:hypothetical protein DXG03_007595, partial [Asterophora parasitica]